MKMLFIRVLSSALAVANCRALLFFCNCFRGSIGRTDLPGGDHDLLMEKLRYEILSLDDDTVVLPGHGECSSIGDEKNWNPFL